MSDFSKACKRAEVVRGHLDAGYELKEDMSIADLKRIEKVVNEDGSICKDLVAVSAKFMEKKDQVDPVTKAARFGPSMIAKIMDFSSNCVSLEEGVALVLEQVQIILQAKLDEEAVAAALEMEQQRELAIQEAAAAQLLAEAGAGARAKEAAEAGRALAEQQLVADKAAAARESKRLEAEAQERARKGAIDALNAEIIRINSLPKGVISFKSCLETIDSSSSSLNARKVLKDILSNITAKPDNEGLRKLRLNSSVLQEKLLSLKGGLEALVACGFKACLQKAEGEDGDLSATSATSATSEGGYSILLIMTEPNPEKDMMGWVEWFDGVGHCLKALE